jgi:hypothetical protein
VFDCKSSVGTDDDFSGGSKVSADPTVVIRAMRACAAPLASSPRACASRRHANRTTRPTRPTVTPRASTDDDTPNVIHENPDTESNRITETAATSSPRPYRLPAEYALTGNTYVAKHFINLKNGIEAVPELEGLGVLDYSFLRVQSTLCEVGDMEKVICELDATFLLNAALGFSCLVYDYGSRDKKRGTPRALWYGVEFIRYALNKTWFGETDRLQILRGKQVEQLFREKLSSMSKSTKKRLKYYRKFIPHDVIDGRKSVRIVGVYKFTEHDDDEEFYGQLVRTRCAPDAAKRSAANPKLVTEAECVDALTKLGFKIHYGGDADEAWIEQVRER